MPLGAKMVLTIVLVIIGVGALYLFNRHTRMIAEWNADPKQHELAELFIAHGDGKVSADLTNFIIAQDWTPRETRNRIAHALGFVKMMAEPAVYKRAYEFGGRLTKASYRLG